MLQIVSCMILSVAVGCQHEDVRALLSLLSQNVQSLSAENVSIEYDYEFSLHQQVGENWEPMVTHSLKRTVLELNASGSLREASWEFDSATQSFMPLPFAEALYDGQRLLWLYVAQQGGELELVLTPRPTLSQSLGMRGDGIMLMLGRTPFYTERELSIYELAAAGESLAIERAGGSSVKILSRRSPIGQVTLEVDEPSRRLSRLEIRTESPQNFYHGARLDSARKRSVIWVANDFEYDLPTADNLLGLRSWRIEELHEGRDGNKYRVDGLIRVKRLAKSAARPMDFDRLVETIHSIPDGTIVRVSGTNAYHYLISDGRLVIHGDPVMQRQLDEAVEGWEVKVPLADGTPRSGIVWLVVVAMAGIAVMVMAWRSYQRSRTKC